MNQKKFNNLLQSAFDHNVTSETLFSALASIWMNYNLTEIQAETLERVKEREQQGTLSSIEPFILTDGDITRLKANVSLEYIKRI